VYGQDGLSERVIGAWFEREKRRNDLVLATKFRFTMGDAPNRSGASRYRIMRCAEASLARWKTDRIDLYQIHMQDIDTPEDETLRALEDLVRQGKVLYIGCSNYAAYRLMNALWTSKTEAPGALRHAAGRVQLGLPATSSASTCRCAAKWAWASCLGRRWRRLFERQIRPRAATTRRHAPGQNEGALRALRQRARLPHARRSERSSDGARSDGRRGVARLAAAQASSHLRRSSAHATCPNSKPT